jgi:GTPase SAR1 family protein
MCEISNFISGLLDRPSLPSSIDEISYKLHITGRACVGKTATVACLSGIKYPSVYVETAGIQKRNIFWPTKIWDKIVLFKLQFWDAGDNSIRRYSYILLVY